MGHLLSELMIGLISSLLLGSSFAHSGSSRRNNRAESGLEFVDNKRVPLIDPDGRDYIFGLGYPYYSKTDNYVPNPKLQPHIYGNPWIVSHDEESDEVKLTAKEFVEYYNSLSEDEKHALDEFSVSVNVGIQNGPVSAGAGFTWRRP